jgi:hypothetical protein
MAISLADLTKSAPPKDPITVLYGVAGVGKDTLASEFPMPVLICTPGENPPAGVTVDAFPEVSTFAQLMGSFEALFTEDHSFKTLIISALAGIERIVWAETCARNKWQSVEEPGYGRGYVEADAVWGEVLDAVRALRRDKGMMIVLIGHTEIKNFDDPAATSYSRYQPNLHKRAAEPVLAAADIVAFVNFRVSIKTEKGAFGAEKKEAAGAGVRTIYLEERPGFIAKNRYSMPESIPFQRGKGFSALAKYLPEVAA